LGSLKERVMAIESMKPGERAEPGGWYFYVVCRQCRKEIIFAKAPSPEEEEQPMVRGVEATCPDCQMRDTYRANEVQRGQVDDND
jgi:ribosomal protein S27E